MVFFFVFFPNVIIWMCRISKTVMFLTVNLTFYMKKFFYLFLKKKQNKINTDYSGITINSKTSKHTNMTVSYLLCYQDLTQTGGACPSEPPATANCQRVHCGLFATWNQCVAHLDSSREGRGWTESFQKHLNFWNSPRVEFKLSVLSQIERTPKQHVFISNLPPLGSHFHVFSLSWMKMWGHPVYLCFCPVLDVKVWG